MSILLVKRAVGYPTCRVAALSGAEWLAFRSVLNTMLSMNGMDCIAVLKAMSEPTRARIVGLLLKENLSVNDIARRVNATQYNVSKHLRILREAGLLVAEKKGKTHFYSVTSQFKARLAEGTDILNLDCCTFRFDKFP